MPTSDTKQRIVILTWVDSFYDDSFHKAEELQHEAEDYVITSVGWLVREGEKTVTIATDFEGTGNGSYREVKRIRRENIREMKVLE